MYCTVEALLRSEPRDFFCCPDYSILVYSVYSLWVNRNDGEVEAFLRALGLG